MGNNKYKNSKLRNKIIVSAFLMILTFGIGMDLFIQSSLKRTLEENGVDGAIIEDIIRKFTTLSLGFIIVSIVIFVAVAFVLAKYMTKSIDSLHAATIRIENGDFNVRIDPSLKETGDEMGELASAFDSMLKEVSGYYNKLENEVEKRTSDLEEAREKEREKVEELKTINEMMIGRELRMVELKNEVEKLKNKITELKK